MLELTILKLGWPTEKKRNRRAPRASKEKAPIRRTSRTVIGMGSRMYASARASRLTEGFGQSNGSADAELTSSLRMMRARSRALVRDVPHAKRAKRIVQNNVVGSGIGLQAQVMSSRGSLNERINDDIESVFEDWSCGENCHTGGSMHLSDIERALLGQVFEAGEVFVRKHYSAFGDSQIPFALELIEAERVVDEFMPRVFTNPPNSVRLGVEVDQFYRPVAYWIRKGHPGDLRLSPYQTDFVERVPADQIMHLRIVDRWPQTRGEPWLHAVSGKLNDMGGYSEAEIIAARGAASYMGTIETPEEVGEATTDGKRELVVEPGIVERLSPGEKFNFIAPNRPNAAMDPFMRLMLREVAAGADVSYESLSRDYSQSNYSSSRLALLDDRDLWRVLQLWFIRSFRAPLHKEWMQQAVLSGAIESINKEQFAISPEKFTAVHFKPRGWSWIDPTKEVDASIAAIRAGLTTVTAEIAKSGDGRDLEDVLNEREQELVAMKEKDLVFDTDPVAVPKLAPPKPAASDSVQPNADGSGASAQGNTPAPGGRQQLVSVGRNR